MASVVACSGPPPILFSVSEDGSEQSVEEGSGEQVTNEKTAYRACPMESTWVLQLVTGLAIYSAVYLFYAQYHIILFYIMTAIIATIVFFLYTTGVLCVLYMVFHDYKGTSRPATVTPSAITIITNVEEDRL